MTRIKRLFGILFSPLPSGGIPSKFKNTHGLLKLHRRITFIYPTRQAPRAQALKFRLLEKIGGKDCQYVVYEIDILWPLFPEALMLTTLPPQFYITETSAILIPTFTFLHAFQLVAFSRPYCFPGD